MQNFDFVECSFTSLMDVIVRHSSTPDVCRGTVVFTSSLTADNCMI
jgi:hypothetical protein